MSTKLSPIREERDCSGSSESKSSLLSLPAVNWNVSSIWEARDRTVRLRDGTLVRVRLYENGWSIGRYEGMDIWQACAVLNGCEARLQNSECAAEMQQEEGRV